VVNEIFLYCLARAAKRTGVEVHAFCVLSNHYHLVVTDPLALLPVFAHWLNVHMARALNAHLGRWENLWSSEPYNAVKLVGERDVLAKVVYTLTNPVAAGLVRRGDDWPGLRCKPDEIGTRRFVVKRPGLFFQDSQPEVATLELTRPQGFPELNNRDYQDLVANLVTEEESAIQHRFKVEGREFLGVPGVLAQSPHQTPRTQEGHWKLSPRVAGRSKWARIEAIQRFVGFVQDYAAALRAFCGGERDTLFPAGTYWMRVYHRVRCAPLPVG
jgi:REP element-mobilizing transposase RayT